jgi:OOP family OmpA-OmpF porin
MKNIFTIVIFLNIFTSFSIYSQSEDSSYKKFNDSIFEIGDRIVAPRIYFSYQGGSRILNESNDSIKVIADFLIKYPNIEIEIGAHTDTRGNEQYNLKISAHRANSVKSVLEHKFEISPNRITTKGYGHSNPIVPNEKIQEAENQEQKEKLHVLNRRIEIKIIKQ